MRSLRTEEPANTLDAVGTVNTAGAERAEIAEIAEDSVVELSAVRRNLRMRVLRCSTTEISH